MSSNTGAASQLGVVVLCTHGSLAWLEAWRPYLARYELTIVHEGAAPVAPAGFLFAQIVDRKNAISKLGASTEQLSALDLAILLSKKQYLLVLDETCQPAAVPKAPVDAALQHVNNLTTPSTPFFFNTLYDPYRCGQIAVTPGCLHVRTQLRHRDIHGPHCCACAGRAQTLCAATPSACVRDGPQLSRMACGCSTLTLMQPPRYVGRCPCLQSACLQVTVMVDGACTSHSTLHAPAHGQIDSGCRARHFLTPA